MVVMLWCRRCGKFTTSESPAKHPCTHDNLGYRMAREREREDLKKEMKHG